MPKRRKKPMKRRHPSPPSSQGSKRNNNDIGGLLGGLNLPGGMGGGGMGGMMAQVQKIQEDMATTQESLKDEIVEASVGGGMITVRMTAMQELRGIEIQPEVVDPDDVEMLQDLLVAAFNQAAAKAQAVSEEKMAPFASMLDMGGFGGLF